MMESYESKQERENPIITESLKIHRFYLSKFQNIKFRTIEEIEEIIEEINDEIAMLEVQLYEEAY